MARVSLVITVRCPLVGETIVSRLVRYLDAETTDRPLDEIEQHLASTPFGRVGRPDDPAALIGWLATQDWIVGQVITSDGGFSLA